MSTGASVTWWGHATTTIALVFVIGAAAVSYTHLDVYKRQPCAFGHTLSPVEPRRALRSKNNRRAMLNAAKRLSEPEPTRAIARGVTCPRCAGRSGVVRTMQPGQLWRKLAEFRSSLTEPPQRGDGGG